MKQLLLICLSTILVLSQGCTKKDDNGGTKPVTPSKLSIKSNTNSQVVLSWIDNSTDELGFTIERKTAGGTYAIAGAVGENITTFTDNGLNPGTSYSYRVSAFNNNGVSAYSNEVTVSTSASPVLTTTQVNVINGVYGNLGAGGGNISSDGGSPITTRGVVWAETSSPTIDLTSKTSDGSGIGTYNSLLTSLKASTTYYIRAYASNAYGTAYGNEIKIITPSVDLKNGLLAYYPFTGNAGDSSGNNNNGTVNGATLTGDRKNRSNAAYNFSTAGATFGNLANQIYVNYNSIFNVSNITVALWVNPSSYYWTGNPNDPRTILINRFEGGYSNPNSQVWGIELNDSNARAYFFEASNVNAQNSALVASSTRIPLNAWTHLAFTYDGTNLKLYVNGNLVGNTPTNLVMNTNSTSGISMGQSRQANGNWNNLSGNLDDVGIWKRALSAEEIKALAAN